MEQLCIKVDVNSTHVDLTSYSESEAAADAFGSKYSMVAQWLIQNYVCRSVNPKPNRIGM